MTGNIVRGEIEFEIDDAPGFALVACLERFFEIDGDAAGNLQLVENATDVAFHAGMEVSTLFNACFAAP